MDLSLWIRPSFTGAVMSVPSNRMVPEVGLSRRFRERRNVDFPHPDGPMMDMTSPLWTSRLMSLRTSWSPKDLARCLTSISTSPSVGIVQPPLHSSDQVREHQYDRQVDDGGDDDREQRVVGLSPDDVRSPGEVDDTDVTRD